MLDATPWLRKQVRVPTEARCVVRIFFGATGPSFSCRWWSNGISSVLVEMLKNTQEPKGWRRLHVEAGAGVMCELPGIRDEPAADASGVGEEQERGGTTLDD